MILKREIWSHPTPNSSNVKSTIMVYDKVGFLTAQDKMAMNVGDAFPFGSLLYRIRYTAVPYAFVDYFISQLSVVANYVSRFAKLTTPMRDTQNAIDPCSSLTAINEVSFLLNIICTLSDVVQPNCCLI